MVAAARDPRVEAEGEAFEGWVEVGEELVRLEEARGVVEVEGQGREGGEGREDGGEAGDEGEVLEGDGFELVGDEGEGGEEAREEGGDGVVEVDGEGDEGGGGGREEGVDQGRRVYVRELEGVEVEGGVEIGGYGVLQE